MDLEKEERMKTALCQLHQCHQRAVEKEVGALPNDTKKAWSFVLSHTSSLPDIVQLFKSSGLDMLG